MRPPATGPATVAAHSRSWVPKRVLVTKSARPLPHTAEIIRRCQAAGVTDIEMLTGDRLTGLRGATSRETYARSKSNLAVVVAPPSALVPQPIPPSADWRIDLARGCPAHCQYCYLAGSLPGPPVIRAYANLDELLAGIGTHAGRGQVTYGTESRGHEGTTFELSCYTDPLGIEGVTGSLSTAITRVGRGDFGNGVQLRFTTKFDDVAALVDLPHARRTRARFSVNAAEVASRFEAGTASMSARLGALRSLARAGYRVGLTIAPIMPVTDWQQAYGTLLGEVAAAIDGTEDLDLSIELITHRFTPSSRETLFEWYPRTGLEMDPGQRTQKRSKFGGVKYVYPRDTMREMRGWFEQEIALRLPAAQILYWT